MKKTLSFLAIYGILLVGLAFPQITGMGVWKPAEKSPFKFPKAYEQTLKDYRKSWTRLTSLEYSGLHWDQGIVIYINKDSRTFINNYIGYLRVTELDEEDCDEEDEEEDCESFFGNFSQGTIVLKENYLLEKGIPTKPMSITVMIKREPGYDPKRGDWQYVQFEPSGKVIVDGHSKDPGVHRLCVECHQNISTRDYIFSTFYRAAQPILNQLLEEE